jgi:hypothetical protein
MYNKSFILSLILSFNLFVANCLSLNNEAKLFLGLGSLFSTPFITNIILGCKKIKDAEKLKNCKPEEIYTFWTNYFDSTFSAIERNDMASEFLKFQNNPDKLKEILQNIFDAQAINGKRIIQDTTIFGAYLILTGAFAKFYSNKIGS